MKKYLFVALLAVASIAAYAQPRAIGANIGYGAAFSYQHGFGESNMLDVAVTVPFFNGIGAIITYDWIDPFGATVPWNEKGEWHWYMGVGGTGGIYGFKDAYWYAGAAGHIGIEYDFWFPMQLSVDWRPNIGVIGKDGVGFNTAGLYDGITLGIRYKF